MLNPTLRWNRLDVPTGFLFIGGPHASSVRPGNRVDDYAQSTLNKLTEAAQIATDRKLIPVILGRLIHRTGENSIPLIARMLRVLQLFPCTPLEVKGIPAARATDIPVEDVESLLHAAGAITLLDDPAFRLPFDIGGHRVILHVAPAGADLPMWLTPAKNQPAAINVLLTHHDLAFSTALPGAAALRAIKGCDMVVNGHMEKTAPAEVHGNTTWHCPGDIEPIAAVNADHRPAVWEWTPGTGYELKPHYLTHNANCFRLPGTQVEAASAEIAVADIVHPLHASKFAGLLSQGQKTAGDAAAGDEEPALVLEADLDVVLSELQVSAATATLLRGLAADVLEPPQ